MNRHYLESDGNGGYRIGKYTSILVTIVIFLVGVTGTFLFNYGILNQKVEVMQDQVTILKGEYDVQSSSIIYTNTKVAVIENQINTMQNDILDIKEMLKEMQKQQDMKIRECGYSNIKYIDMNL